MRPWAGGRGKFVSGWEPLFLGESYQIYSYFKRGADAYGRQEEKQPEKERDRNQTSK